jgi:hypothetical protein
MNRKKKALHRLLYCNFIGDLYDSEYLKFTCDNKGKCCTLNHLKKIPNEERKSNDSIEIIKEISEIKINKNTVFF